MITHAFDSFQHPSRERGGAVRTDRAAARSRGDLVLCRTQHSPCPVGGRDGRIVSGREDLGCFGNAPRRNRPAHTYPGRERPAAEVASGKIPLSPTRPAVPRSGKSDAILPVSRKDRIRSPLRPPDRSRRTDPPGPSGRLPVMLFFRYTAAGARTPPHKPKR